MKNVLILGAIGSLVPFVVDAIKDVQLTLFVRKKTRLSKNISKNVAVVEGDAVIFRLGVPQIALVCPY